MKAFAVGDDRFGIWGIGDYFWDFTNIVFALENDIPERILFGWYDQEVDRVLTDNRPRINL